MKYFCFFLLVLILSLKCALLAAQHFIHGRIDFPPPSDLIVDTYTKLDAPTKECRDRSDPAGHYYRGTFTLDMCIDWNSKVLEADGFVHNYCRNPNNDHRGPWCYFQRGSRSTMRCPPIPFCPDVAIDVLPKACGEIKIQYHLPFLFQPATYGSRPYVVLLGQALGTERLTFCAGSIISEDWIVTASHCIIDNNGTLLDASNLYVDAGAHNRSQQDEHQQTFAVEEVIPHENYDVFNKSNDIALVRIKRVGGKGIQFTDYVQPICLPKTYADPKDRCAMSGWGKDGKAAEVLYTEDVPVLNGDICETHLGPSIIDEESMFCAGRYGSRVEACDGDSGGPIACKDDDGRHYLTGVSSLAIGGDKCREHPTVYVKVGAYYDWIIETIASRVF